MTQYMDCIVFLLAKAYQKSQNHLKTKLRPYGLTSVQALLLEALWEEQGLTAGEIGKRLALDNATVSGVLERLADARWIIKKNDPADKRVIRVYLSTKAMKHEASLIQERTIANDEILHGFSDAEKILLKRFLKDLL
ncbi:MAG: MarR family transcriptional regulator [Pseudomonadota bacterium]